MNKPRGTNDILPKDSGKWQFVEEKFREVSKRFNFSEIRTPTFESTELFLRGVGDTTDIVSKQMYTFNDLAGRSLTLKPEGTAGVCRALIEEKLYAGVMPLKFFYQTNCFRYEKPQDGRRREFHQFGVELIGSYNMLSDAVVIKLGKTFFDELDIKNIILKINSIGCKKCRPKYYETLKTYFRENESKLCETCRIRMEKNPMRILDCKSETCKKIAKGAPIILDYICEDCKTDFEKLQEYLNAFNIDFIIDPFIVRGLDYYTKTAFEFLIGGMAILGGGRYDELIEELGGPKLSGVGFALGVERLLLEIPSSAFLIDEDKKYLIIGVGDSGERKAIELYNKMTSEGKKVLLDENMRNIKGQFKYADKIGITDVVMIGDKEIEKNIFTIKNMKTGEQKEVEKI
ncbi:MAG: histidine--tRNA ligase [Clostridiales Family XIII bacterium]|jgi:histidyl-tRNA synthetase|nr:histidine--tRNA ligase [Clostridiales Family XIII bacterium]